MKTLKSDDLPIFQPILYEWLWNAYNFYVEVSKVLAATVFNDHRIVIFSSIEQKERV